MKTILSLSGTSDNQHALAYESTGFWGRRGAGCIVQASSGRILLPLRSDNVLQPNTWGTWGGAVDEGEDLIHAALRELREESGYADVPLSVSPIYRYVSGDFTYTTFLVRVRNEFTPLLIDGETSRAQWFDLDRLPSNLHFGLKAILKSQSAMLKLREHI